MWAETFGKFAIVVIKVQSLVGETEQLLLEPNYVAGKHIILLILEVEHDKRRELIRFENAGHFVKSIYQTLVTHRLLGKIEKMKFIKFVIY